jgi:hypothetical protein
MAGIHNDRSADDVGQGARCQRSSCSLQNRLSRHRQRKLGLRRQRDTGLLSKPTQIYSRFVCNFNPAQQDKQQMLKIGVGPGGGEPRWTEWTEAIMKAY